MPSPSHRQRFGGGAAWGAGPAESSLCCVQIFASRMVTVPVEYFQYRDAKAEKSPGKETEKLDIFAKIKAIKKSETTLGARGVTRIIACPAEQGDDRRGIGDATANLAPRPGARSGETNQSAAALQQGRCVHPQAFTVIGAGLHRRTASAEARHRRCGAWAVRATAGRPGLIPGLTARLGAATLLRRTLSGLGRGGRRAQE